MSDALPPAVEPAEARRVPYAPDWQTPFGNP